MTDIPHRDEPPDRDEAALAKLLRLGGPRPPVPEDVCDRVYSTVRKAWDDLDPGPAEDRVHANVRRAWLRRPGRHPLRVLFPLALAMTVAIAAGLWLRSPVDETATSFRAGVVVRAIGDGLPAGTEIRVGDRIRTGADEALSILLPDAASLRVDEDTALTVVARNRFELENGRIYADTGDRIYRDSRLVVDTPHGVVRDVGTQFSVLAAPDALGIAVREGRVDLERGDETHIAVAGERLQLMPGAAPNFERVQPHDPSWEWATALAPAYDIEGKSLLDFLRWAARETGRELVFEDPDLRSSAARTDLHGSVADFAPIEAVQSVLATTRFQHRIEDGRILIEH